MKQTREQKLSKTECKAEDVVFDIKTIMQDYYFADFMMKGDELEIALNNGQKFAVKVKAITN